MKYLTLLIIISSQLLTAQAPDTLWTKTFRGNGWDEGRYVQQTNDGGYIIVGSTFSYGIDGVDVWLIKTDASGDTLWTKTINGENDDYGNCAKQTTDGGFIITGATYPSASGNSDVWLIKTDQSGDTLWTKSFDGNGADWGNSVNQTTDGGYIIAGLTGNIGQGTGDIWLIKTNASGDSLWTKTYGGSNEDEGRSVQQTSDGGYIITGYKNGMWWLGREAFLMKIDASGDSLWMRTYRSYNWSHGQSVIFNADGGFTFTGYFRPANDHNDMDVWLLKTDALGDTVWIKTFGKIGWEDGFSVQQLSDEGYIIAGSIGSYSDNKDVLLIRTDASGDTVWTKTFIDTGMSYAYSVQETSDGGYIVLANKNNDIWLIKTEVDPSGFKLSNDNIKSEDFTLSHNYPNPFNPSTTIEFFLTNTVFVTLKIYNLLGQEVTTLVAEKLKSGTYQYNWDAGSLASGVYLYHLQAGENVETKKMILMK